MSASVRVRSLLSLVFALALGLTGARGEAKAFSIEFKGRASETSAPK